jgi:hypothetical protein
MRLPDSGHDAPQRRETVHSDPARRVYDGRTRRHLARSGELRREVADLVVSRRYDDERRLDRIARQFRPARAERHGVSPSAKLECQGAPDLAPTEDRHLH